MTTTPAQTIARTYTVSLAGETFTGLDQDAAQAKIDELAQRYGGVPQVTQEEVPEARVARPTNWDAKAEHVDAEGAARSEADRQLAIAAGFSPAVPLFTRGTRLMEIGVENARAARQAYEEKPLLTEVCADLERQVVAEQRRDDLVRATQLRMTAGGEIVADVIDAEHQVTGRWRYTVEREALPQLVRALGMPSGAPSYLAAIPAETRAINVNRWNRDAQRDEDEAILAEKGTLEPRAICLRTRRVDGQRAIYAAVSERYGAFDADSVARLVSRALGDTGARGDLFYDGRRVRLSAHFFTTVPEDEFVAGEFFRAGVLVTTDDTGAGSLKIDAVLEQNLCLNLLIIQRDAKPIATIRHMGDEAELAKRVEAAVVAAQGMIAPFVAQWSRARRDVYEPGQLREGLTASEFFAAYARAIVEQELVPVGIRELPGLTAAYEADQSSLGPSGPLTRAGVVNAFTRYAQAVDPFRAAEIERAASRLVWAGDLPEPIFA